MRKIQFNKNQLITILKATRSGREELEHMINVMVTRLP